MAQEAQHEPDSRLKITERPVEDGDEEEKNGGGEETNGGGDAGEEKNGGRGDTVDEVGCEDDTDEEDSEDELRGFDEDGNPYKPFIWRRQLRICPAGNEKLTASSFGNSTRNIFFRPICNNLFQN